MQIDEFCNLLGIPFSDEQIAVITAPLEPNIVIAGAGTGKTTVMAARVVWLVLTGQVTPDQVLGLTFTKKAAGELEERIRRDLRRGGVSEDLVPTVSTYDSFAQSLIAEFGPYIGIDPDRRLITDATRYRIASTVVKNTSAPMEHLGDRSLSDVVSKVVELDASLVSHRAEPHAVLQSNEALRLTLETQVSNRQLTPKQALLAVTASHERDELVKLVEEYRRAKDEANVAEFGDIMADAARLAEDVPSARRDLRERFAAVLLDEYQDTSYTQTTLLQTLFADGHPVTAVGDPYQAIYGWRGAAVDNIAQFAHRFSRSDGQPATGFDLTINRRSDAVILDVANDIARGPDESKTGLEGAQDRELCPRDEADPGEVRFEKFDSDIEEAAWIASEVANLHDCQVPLSQIAILVRTNATMVPLYEALQDRGIPVEVVGLSGLLSVPEVVDVLGTLRLLIDADANPELVRLLSGPRWRIGLDDLTALGRAAKDSDGERIPLLEVLGRIPGASDEGKARMRRLDNELKDLRRHIHEPVPEFVARVISTIGARREVEGDPQLHKLHRARQLDRFAEFASQYAAGDPDASLEGFIAWCDDSAAHDRGLGQAVVSSEDSVKLLTIHTAKGLEWQVCFLPSLSADVFPAPKVTDDWLTTAAVIPASLRGDREAYPQLEEQIRRVDERFMEIAEFAGRKDRKKGEKRPTKINVVNEYRTALAAHQAQSERRLAYVAVTRAKSLLIGTWNKGKMSAKKEAKPSEYVSVIERYASADASSMNNMADEPLNEIADVAAWPEPDEDRWRLDIAQRVRDNDTTGIDALNLDEQEIVAAWRESAEMFVNETSEWREARLRVEMPRNATVSDYVRASIDPQGFARDVVRPMPRYLSTESLVGTEFHAWVEEHYRMSNDACEELVEGPDARLNDLKRAFLASEFAAMRPLAIEEPFILSVAGRQIRGRLDAVFPASDPDYEFLVVDWKTFEHSAPPVQLQHYRLAWAQTCGVPVARVQAGFYHVATDRLELAEPLPEDEIIRDITSLGA